MSSTAREPGVERSAIRKVWVLSLIYFGFISGTAAAAGIALINTMGNIAGFAAGFVTGWLKDLTSDYYVPMLVVSGAARH